MSLYLNFADYKAYLPNRPVLHCRTLQLNLFRLVSTPYS